MCPLLVLKEEFTDWLALSSKNEVREVWSSLQEEENETSYDASSPNLSLSSSGESPSCLFGAVIVFSTSIIFLSFINCGLVLPTSQLYYFRCGLLIRGTVTVSKILDDFYILKISKKSVLTLLFPFVLFNHVNGALSPTKLDR